MNDDTEAQDSVMVSINPKTRTVNYQSLEEFRDSIVRHMARDRKLKKGLKKGIAVMLVVAAAEAIGWMYGLIHVALAGLTAAVMVGCSLHSVRLIRYCRERLAESAQNLAYVEGRIQEQARSERGEEVQDV